MKKALLISALLILALGCRLSNIVDEVTRTGEQPLEQIEPRQEQPTAEYRNHNDPVASSEELSSSPDSLETIYIDDFSSSEGGWDVQSSDNLYTNYVDGTFHIAIYSSFYDAWANPDFYYGDDAQIEVDATLIGGEDDNNFGILCRYSGTPSSPNFYFFEISSDGYAVIGKTIDGIPEYISDEQMMLSNSINQGYATNHLRADCIGSQLTFYVNGTNIISTSDSSLYDGGVGLIAGTFDAAYTELAFDNFFVIVP